MNVSVLTYCSNSLNIKANMSLVLYTLYLGKIVFERNHNDMFVIRFYCDVHYSLEAYSFIFDLA